jgi:ketosteroid isomerase-like protein
MKSLYYIILSFLVLVFLVFSCSTGNQKNLTAMNNTEIIQEVRQAAGLLTGYSAKSQIDSFLSCYSDSRDFRAFSADGMVRNFDEFSKIAREYYDSVSKQDISTTREDYAVVDSDLVIYSWLGNIDAHFKNGNLMKMKNYGVSFVYKKLPNGWKVIHSHESSLPPEIIKPTK